MRIRPWVPFPRPTASSVCVHREQGDTRLAHCVLRWVRALATCRHRPKHRDTGNSTRSPPGLGPPAHRRCSYSHPACTISPGSVAARLHKGRLAKEPQISLGQKRTLACLLLRFLVVYCLIKEKPKRRQCNLPYPHQVIQVCWKGPLDGAQRGTGLVAWDLREHKPPTNLPDSAHLPTERAPSWPCRHWQSQATIPKPLRACRGKTGCLSRAKTQQNSLQLKPEHKSSP